MNEIKRSTSRRTLLQRSLLFVAGACGLQLAAREEQAADPPSVPAGGKTLTYYSSNLRACCSGQTPGQLPTWNSPAHRHGDLLDQPDGRRVGEFRGTGLAANGALPATPGGFNLELQTLSLADGTLFGIGTAGSPGVERAHAIVGGTGRFIGAQGSYVICRPSGNAGNNTIEFKITLLT